ncbi:class I SAM-dependent methyltransferase [Erwinia persicina]|uniref:SAM-dependent methyltransferase n=1 Tax=Erwinia persicina TaxID=55211 RepID=A0A3S7S422_9GAMM|nr:class I SAM-dependent methyltransferase [Erwinia persicina]AXU95491.1 SAM-dependent methyltransferase [Erwinia persicina]MBC3945882.1 class I SAM-dependent methyltransferase [Erwinia persicina]MBD8105440.1 class I SAM-dependent methyltransferase [Erwinia persicina]MBD8208586.1 class I SAM-dependent methyltransferase [Erwinia persicina]MCQ4092677.1 class I SAM-dependent methyltransferase [Erwinia persicina]
MTQNIYDNPDFFAGYATLNRSTLGLEGAPEWPAVQAILPPLKQRQVVDLGCGYGWFSRYACQQGADAVLAIDVSEKMLAKAVSLGDNPAIDWRRADLETLTLPPQRYDLAWSALALHYVEALPALLQTVFASLKPGGQFIFTAEHPIYTAPRNPGWLSRGEQQKCWPLSDYQREGQRVTNWFADGVIKQHRTLGSWINHLVAAGFTIDSLNEWGPTPQQIAQQPALAEEQERPMLFIMAVTRPKA